MARELVVENGGGTGADANSYLSVDEANEILENDPNAVEWFALEDEAKVEMLIAATKFLDNRWRFYGKTYDASQPLQWPRTKNYDDKGVIIPAGTIPNQIKDALLSLVKVFSTDPEAFEGIEDGSGTVKSWSTDGMSLSFGTATHTAGVGFEGAEVLLGDRYVNVEFNLRSLGTLKDVDWLQRSKQTVVR